jgi:glycosyltransferase involved in cell wall biosynthesis
MKLLISVPCYNEEQLIENTIKNLPRKIDGFDEVKILIINDGSTDTSEDIIKKLKIDHYFKFENNVGLAKVFEKSLEIANIEKYDVLVNFDGDNQYPEKKIVDLCRPILKNEVNYCIGARNFELAKDFTFIKKKLQVYGNKIFSFILFNDSKKIKDFTSGFRAIDKSLFKKLEFYSSFSYTVESIVQLANLNEKIYQIDIVNNRVNRPSRLVKSNFDFIIRQTITLFKVLAIHNPLAFFLKISFVLFFLSVVIFIRYFFYFFIDAGSEHIASLIAGALIFTSSVFLFSLGLIADQVLTIRKAILKIRNKIDDN